MSELSKPKFLGEGMSTCHRSISNLLSPPNKPVCPPREGQCPVDQEFLGLLSYRRATARASWHSSVQTLLVQANTAGTRWLLGGTTSLLPPIASQKRDFKNLGDAKAYLQFKQASCERNLPRVPSRGII